MQQSAVSVCPIHQALKLCSPLLKTRRCLDQLTSMRVNRWRLLPESVSLFHGTAARHFTTRITTLSGLRPYLTLLKLNTSSSLPSSRAIRTIMTDQEQPWYAAYPPARSNPESISRSALLQLLKQSSEDERFVLVDLRRTDHEVRRRWIENLYPWSCWPIHVLIRIAGWNHNGLHQPPSPKSLSDNPIAVRPFPRC